MSQSLMMAIGLMLIIEGIFPLFLPQAWRENFKRLIAMSDGQLRFIGLMSMIGGFLLLLFFGH